MTHAAILSGKYEKFVVNDIHGFGIRLFCDAIAGKCRDAWRHWVSREEFFRMKDSDPIVSLCWSFSNNGRDYLYARSKEAAKRKEHERRVRGDGPTMELETSGRLQSLRQCEALERLQALERDYRDVEIATGDVVYADKPYANTRGYNTQPFDHPAFWEWARTRPFVVFISEYHAPPDFTPIWYKAKCQLMHANGGSNKAGEYVFVADRFAAEYQTDLFLGTNDKGRAQ